MLAPNMVYVGAGIGLRAKLFTSGELEDLTKKGTVDKWFKALEEQFKTDGKIPEVKDPRSFYTADAYAAASKG